MLPTKTSSMPIQCAKSTFPLSRRTT